MSRVLALCCLEPGLEGMMLSRQVTCQTELHILRAASVWGLPASYVPAQSLSVGYGLPAAVVLTLYSLLQKP